MPSAPGKGKKPLSEVAEYDPNHNAALGKGREKKQKTTSASKVKRGK